MIFPGGGTKQEPLKYTPKGTISLTSDSELINLELHVSWLKQFIHYARPTEYDPVLLIPDNYTSH
jgi:hypothetical protein